MNLQDANNKRLEDLRNKGCNADLAIVLAKLDGLIDFVANYFELSGAKLYLGESDVHTAVQERISQRLTEIEKEILPQIEAAQRRATLMQGVNGVN